MTAPTILPDTTGATFEKFWAGLIELREAQKRTDAQLAKTDAQLEKTSKELGNFTNKFGSLVEEFIAAGLVDKFRQLGYEFESCARNLVVKSKLHDVDTEVDAWLTNGDYTLAAEVKTELTIDYIDHHLERLQQLRRYADAHRDKRKILGAVGGAKVSPEAREYAQRNGLFVLVQSGESIKIAACPKNFRPREW
jgi:hypothetical protein